MSTDSIAQDLIRSFFERWERLETEKDAISGDLKELFAEAKGNGFDTKVLRKLFRDQKADASERQEFEALYDLYAAALNAPRVRDARDAREDDEEFDPETGEIKSQHRSSEATGAVPNKASTGANAGGENVAAPDTQDIDEPSAEMGNDPGVSAGIDDDFDGKSRDGGLAPISAVELGAPNSQHGAESAEDEPQVATVRAASSANSSRAKAAHAASRGEDVGQHQASSDPGTAGAGEPGRHYSASADADPALNSLPRHDVEEAGEGEVTPPASSATHSEPAEAAPPASAGHGDRSATQAAAPVVAGNVVSIRTHNPETHFLNSEGLLRLHGCLKAENCGSSEPRKRLCFSCSVKHDGPTYQDEAAG